jgi:D-serine deaminase-like pyridoxal phosphate-dependent protein
MLAPMDWSGYVRALEGERLPAAIVDLDALDRNVLRLRRRVERTQKTLRVASKSVRHVGLLRRILETGGDVFRGLMCFTLEEAVFLSDEGFDDLLVAYPSVERDALAEIASRVKRGATIRVMADDRAHLLAYGRAAADAGVSLEVVLDLDVSYEALGGRVHLGVQRSSIRSVERLVEIVRAARAIDGISIAGLMGYEAHVAGLPDASPFSARMNRVKRAIKTISVPRVARIRRDAVRALHREGIAPKLVNGGGTGSVDTTLEEPWLTEITAGSGFVCSHLFDYYRGNELEPAAFFALEVSRIPQPGIVTCLGGGYVASGEPGWDRLPIPYLPRGLRYLPMEGAGEVQTPLSTSPETPALAVGDPILFRHAKAGELAERFNAYTLLRGGQIVGREPTYRGMGKCFL